LTNTSGETGSGKTKNPIFTVANLVTTIRIILIPLFVYVLLAPWPSQFPYLHSVEPYKPWFAAGVFAVLALTDGVDGYLARSRGEVTTLGKFLDPLADKILVCAALLAFCELGTLPSWVALIIIARDFIVSGLRMVASSEGVIIPASWIGKTKTAVTIVAILMFIVKDSATIQQVGPRFAWWFQICSWGVMILAIILTIYSMVDYFVKADEELHMFKPKPDDHDMRTIDEMAKDVLELGRSHGKTIATAESCTGGGIATALTDIPNSSDSFVGGAVTYANQIKESMLGVDAHDIEEHGAVSPEVAEQMASGALRRFGSDVAVSVTGIAGPGGAVPGKPVGTVWFGIAGGDEVRTDLQHFEGDRKSVREQAVKHALQLLEQELED
jgi:nicotinamide-nucleotide amidase